MQFACGCNTLFIDRMIAIATVPTSVQCPAPAEDNYDKSAEFVVH